MRSDSSTCAGRPEAMRPDTYFTSGEYATTSRSRARSSPDALYRRQRSRSSMALTLVSMGAGRLRARVTLGVRRSQAGGVYPRIDLSRGDCCVAEHLLDGAGSCSAFEQVGGERVTQRVGGDAAWETDLARPVP